MTGTQLARMEDQLILHEGLRTHPYPDTDDPPNWTIAIGYNITSRGWDFFEQIVGRQVGPTATAVVTEDEARAVCVADIQRIEQATKVYFPFYTQLDPIRQRVVIDCAFNMGLGALGFKNTTAAIERRDWSAAAKGLWASKWRTQVEPHPDPAHVGRADRLCQMLLTGQDYTS